MSPGDGFLLFGAVCVMFGIGIALGPAWAVFAVGVLALGCGVALGRNE